MNESSKPVYRIADLPADERPRERLRRLGPQALSTSELLAILLRVGVAGESAIQVGQRLLSKYKNLAGLHRAPFEDLCSQHGIGEAKAAQIKAAIELGSRMSSEKLKDRPTINSPSDAAALVAYDMSALEQEHLSVILLDTRNQVLDIVEVYKGSVNSSQVHVGELFKPAIRRNASALIVVHNHPSGDPTPSPDDIAVTRSIVQAGKLLDVDVLDHMVIGQGEGKWVSLKERGLGFALND
jgi:DNA repair protein RadC